MKLFRSLGVPALAVLLARVRQRAQCGPRAERHSDLRG